MPSTATITAFYSFVSGTKARSSQVNTNFDNFRGHFIPINTDTQTASDQTHDLGSSDHQWRRIYVKEAPYVNGQKLGKLQIETLFEGSNSADVLDNPAWLPGASFPADQETGVKFSFIVPDEYTAGQRMGLGLRGYCEVGEKHISLESGAALYKHNSGNMGLTAPANTLTTTASVQPPTTAALMFTNASLYITDSNGLINSVTVTAGDVISCYLKRKGEATADTNTGAFNLTNVQIELNI